MKVVVAPEKYDPSPNDIKVFLAGGITGCEDWQSAVLKELDMLVCGVPFVERKLVVMNPRRENFPINDPNAAVEQISWEFKMLEMCDVFSMYFSDKQPQPICLYELGRNLLNMKLRFPTTYKSRICISCNEKYERIQDVKIQTSLALFNNATSFDADSGAFMIKGISPKAHAEMILKCVLDVDGFEETI